jgi:hypothetical protein
MIIADLKHCTTLEQWHEEIVSQQTKVHGEHYCNHHEVIKGLIEEGCESYKELGTHQGASAAAAILAGADEVFLVDPDFSKMMPYMNLFEDYYLPAGITLTTYCGSSHDRQSAGPCDLLFVDSLHKAPHLQGELDLHAQYVRKYMVFHDTKHKPELYRVLEKFTAGISQWEIDKHINEGHGVTILKRKVWI